ncbi:MAG: hypothetical protein COY66_05695 [Candidatus Kerfeldbacteria bacterium CG_4_10_14_0_8_um_filter_42_10]|uniref:Uncharacterized protein n=1 Tax=Candidatus Kerfeldbacteria bacterium CG_4_10_14_0_8_um_filter_42_10 TaxID=2014248 RepID=A0A2M7RH67_9BACT|nr:MAG: hypothetical protein COY66_05695 [Candidatus Kerfeldbacteria bacterium CG_4_10_14_0_8_um_filter_42_10]
MEAFLSRTSFGLILRVFAQKEADISNRIEMVRELVERAAGVSVFGHRFLKAIDVLVWADNRYESDCGKTTSALRKAVPKKVNGVLVPISEVRHGDLFCGILNHGIGLQSRRGIDYSMIVSPEAFSYLNTETTDQMVFAATKGALAVGVAINELTQSILEGRIANTFAMWHNLSLLTVGGFDLRAAKPIADDRIAEYVRGWHPDKGEVFYQIAGVEEVIPLARLAETYGPCIAPIMPQGEGVQRYVVPDPIKSPELYLRHVSKMGTKLERQSHHLAQIGFDLTYLKGGVMPDYRTV